MNNNKINKQDIHRYDDLLDLPHHQSSTRPHMSLYDRAAQFSPFAALTGYDDEVKETARLIDQKIELDENKKAILNEKLQFLEKNLKDLADNPPVVSFTYFVPDILKDGGSYVTVSDVVKRIDHYERKIILQNTIIPIEDIVDIKGDLFQLA